MVITGAATTSTLHESRLKIIFRSVASDSESSSEVTNLRLRISERKFEKISELFRFFQNFSDFFRFFQNFSEFHDFFGTKVVFPENQPPQKSVNFAGVARMGPKGTKAKVSAPKPLTNRMITLSDSDSDGYECAAMAMANPIPNGQWEAYELP